MQEILNQGNWKLCTVNGGPKQIKITRSDSKVFEFIQVDLNTKQFEIYKLDESSIYTQLEEQGYNISTLTDVLSKISSELNKIKEFQNDKENGNNSLQFTISLGGKFTASFHALAENEEISAKFKNATLFDLNISSRDVTGKLKILFDDLEQIIENKDRLIDMLQSMVKEYDTSMVDRWIPKTSKSATYLKPFEKNSWLSSDIMTTKDEYTLIDEAMMITNRLRRPIHTNKDSSIVNTEENATTLSSFEEVSILKGADGATTVERKEEVTDEELQVSKSSPIKRSQSPTMEKDTTSTNKNSTKKRRFGRIRSTK